MTHGSVLCQQEPPMCQIYRTAGVSPRVNLFFPQGGDTETPRPPRSARVQVNPSREAPSMCLSELWLSWGRTEANRFPWDLPSPWSQSKHGKHKRPEAHQSVPPPPGEGTQRQHRQLLMTPPRSATIHKAVVSLSASWGCAHPPTGQQAGSDGLWCRPRNAICNPCSDGTRTEPTEHVSSGRTQMAKEVSGRRLIPVGLGNFRKTNPWQSICHCRSVCEPLCKKFKLFLCIFLQCSSPARQNPMISSADRH